MKLNKTKKQDPKALASQVDTLCESYEKAHKIVTEANAAKARSNDGIKKLADKFGVRKGDDTIVEGDRYLAGFSEIKSSFLDAEEAKKVLPRKVFEKLEKVETVRTLDNDEFLRLVDSGEITADQAKKIIKHGNPQKRILIRSKLANPRP